MIEDLKALIGDDKVSAAQDVLDLHATDRWNYAHPPEVVVFAESTDDVVAVMKYANEHEIPVTTRGAGVGYVGGCVPLQGGIALSVARMNRLIDLNPRDGVAVVQPGLITGDLQAAAAEIGWYYPPDPASLKECSIGGNIATNAGGPRCLKYGVTKQYVLGLTVVLADGSVLKTGGRCHKNKTGFDLPLLFTGSEGLLGIITEATLRIIPHPQARGMITATFEHFSNAAEAVQKILDSGFLPSALEITDSFTLAAARSYLGDAALPPGDAHLIVEIDGRSASLPLQLDELRDLLDEVGAISTEIYPNDAACESIWSLRRDFSYSLRATGLTKLNEDVVVPRSKLVDLVTFAEKLQLETGIPVACFGHAGDGNIHVNLMVESYDDPETAKKADAALDRLFSWVMDNDGAITGEHGVGMAKSRWLRDAIGETSFQTHLALKTALDPKGILNPGKFLSETPLA